MMSIETHPFQPFNTDGAKSLILGSFPCFNGKDHGEWYYSGSGKSEFWKLLSETFNKPVSNLQQKQDLCLDHQIALTDVAYKIQRRKGNCSDRNLNIIEYNTDGISQCLSPLLKRVLFTSKYVEKQFRYIFPNLNIPTETLLSPSQSSNLYIVILQDYKLKILNNEVSNPYEYRLLHYKKMLNLSS